MTYPNTAAEFTGFVGRVESSSGYRRPAAFGIGQIERFSGTVKGSIMIIERLSFETVNYNESYGTAAVISYVMGIPRSPYRFEPSFKKLQKILSFFRAFEGENGHPNLEALKHAAELAKRIQPGTWPAIFPVIVFIDEGNLFKDQCHDILLDCLRKAKKHK